MPIRKVFFDLNHPADFHLFKHLMEWMKGQDYALRIVARDKECLHLLLDDAGLSYISRGPGKHTLLGKYLYATWVLALISFELIRFRPSVCICLSSPYLTILSRLLRIPCICYDDTDDNPRLLPLIRQATYLLSPANYPHKFHRYHFHLPVLKELAYLHPSHFQHSGSSRGIFFRFTRTDSIHHSKDSAFDQLMVMSKITKLTHNNNIVLSSELKLDMEETDKIHPADPIHIHRDLAKCKVFWGNSGTMAAEAAVLGIPAIFVSSEKFAYICELEEHGLLYHYHPDQLNESLDKIDSILAGDPPMEHFQNARKALLKDKLDMTAFLIWFIKNLPESPYKLEKNPDITREFFVDL